MCVIVDLNESSIYGLAWRRSDSGIWYAVGDVLIRDVMVCIYKSDE